MIGIWSFIDTAKLEPSYSIKDEKNASTTLEISSTLSLAHTFINLMPLAAEKGEQNLKRNLEHKFCCL